MSRRFTLALFTLAISTFSILGAHVALAQGTPAQAPQRTLDDTINANIGSITEPFVSFIFSPLPGTEYLLGVGIPWILLWLIIAATVFTLYFGFIQFRAFGLAIDHVRGRYSDPNDPGEVSHFQALSTALSGTVGLGNIAGVAVAVSIGGPGATFWMILAGLMGMATKFTECTLGVKYRDVHTDGTVSGGPMYYLSKGLDELGMPTFGRVLAVLFSICCVMGALGAGNMFQANQVHAQLVSITGGPTGSTLANYGWATGLVMALAIFAVIVGGIKSIARVAEAVVPFMAVIYLVTAAVILAMHYDKIGWAFGQIFAGAFTGLGIAGGIIGALIQGFKRAAFSNEAGLGSAAIAHSAVRTKEPITEGFVSLLEPFIDTVVICTMTALVIIITGVLVTDPQTGLYVWNAEAKHIATVGNLEGVNLTSAAFGKVFSWFPYLLAIAVTLFAFSTMMAWSYYGMKAWTYLFGEGRAIELTFKLMFCAFIIVGASMKLGAVIDFADASVFAMALFNIAGLYLLMPVVKRELNSYLARLKTGEIRRHDTAGH